MRLKPMNPHFHFDCQSLMLVSLNHKIDFFPIFGTSIKHAPRPGVIVDEFDDFHEHQGFKQMPRLGTID